MPSSPQHILFLDGDCIFCQRSAIRIHKMDRNTLLHFSTLQGEAAHVLPKKWRDTNNPKSAAVLVEKSSSSEETCWRGLDALLRCLYLIGLPYSSLWIFHWLPTWLKNFIYFKVSALRYRLSEHITCPMPSDSFKKQVLK